MRGCGRNVKLSEVCPGHPTNHSRIVSPSTTKARAFGSADPSSELGRAHLIRGAVGNLVDLRVEQAEDLAVEEIQEHIIEASLRT